MFTSEIDSLLHNTPGFVGVFAANEFPTHFPQDRGEPYSLVINSDPSWKPGRHWLALIVCPLYGKVIYFDSMALPPEQVLGPHGQARLKELCLNRRLETSPFAIQAPPTLEDVLLEQGDCGQFCIYIIHHLPTFAYNLQKLVHTHFLPTDPLFNQKRALRYIRQVFGHSG